MAGRFSPDDLIETAFSAHELSSVAAEISLLETHLQPLDLRGLLRDALKAVSPWRSSMVCRLR